MGEKHLEKLDFDPYETLELTEECSVDDIKKAYRKKALQWHPDKNPDHRDYAQKIFLQIAKASEILLDTLAKAALDRVRKAKREHKQRTQKLDAKRRKLKEDLEAREQQSQSEKDDEAAAAERLSQEVERLRKQGSDLLKSMREEVEQQIQKEKAAAAAAAASQAEGVDLHNRLKVSWPLEDASFDADALTQRFKKYGSIVAVVVGPMKKKAKVRTALVELSTFDDAKRALIGENSIPDNVLRVSWLAPPPPPANFGRQSPAFPTSSSGCAASHDSSRSNSPFARPDAGLPSDRDFESVVLMRMRQAEERKRLIEQMQQEDKLGEENA